MVEVAYSQSETNFKDKIERYWLLGGQAHDGIAIKIEQPIAPAIRPSVMTVRNDKIQFLLNFFSNV